ncbi:MAG: alpha-L-fucosidase [Chitinispirillaceae bacterium]|nr:alpha-L-fucosidase [Chitinispirillaceae bacterium]
MSSQIARCRIPGFFPLKKRRPLRSRRFTPSFFLLCVVSCLTPSFAQGLTLDSLLRRHVELRFGMFMHFNMNTYYPGWGNNRVDPKLFNPTGLNCAQWAATAKAAGMKYGVLTAKHHDGFAVWPSQQVPPNGQPLYTVAQSSTPAVDVVRSYVDAFREADLLPGLYFSMWDVANGVNDNWAQSRTFVLGQLTELLGGRYGQIPLLMIDGWDWKMGHHEIPYQQIRDTIKKMQPNCLLANMNGLMSPWEGDLLFVEEPKGLYCPAGNIYAACQSPTISADWFWDSSATRANALMTLTNILSRLSTLQSRYCNVLLNCPPNRAGVLDQAIVDRLGQVGNSWSPNPSRAPLPPQPPNIEHPVRPVSATASSGSAANAIDGFADCFSSTATAYCTSPGQTLWTSSGTLPQHVTMNLGAVIQNIGIVGYLPQAAAVAGQITDYSISLSIDNATFTTVAAGTWPADRNYKTATFTPAPAQYVRLAANAVSSGGAAIASEINCGVIAATPVLSDGNVKKSAAGGSVTLRVIGSRIVLPKGFSGKTATVAVYGLSGQLLRKATVQGKTVDIGGERRTPDGVYIVKVYPAR